VRERLIHRSSASPEQTEEFGALLGITMQPRGDAPIIVYLTGDLGAGKTTLAKGFVRGCGITDAVRSPTYALVEPYEGQAFTVVHLDLYRLRDPCELEPLGLRDWAQPGNAWLVEWPQRGGGKLPLADVKITLSVGEDTHEITAEGLSPYGQAWLGRANTA
jgi:tRNA threonylcarbamoyladenosine biosynthesis protein TsaE